MLPDQVTSSFLMNRESNTSLSADTRINWGRSVLLVLATLILTYLVAAFTFIIRWMHFWIRGSYFAPYLGVFLTTQALLLLGWIRRHHNGPLPLVSTTMYSMVAGYVAGTVALVLYPMFQPDGLQQAVNSLRFPTIEAAMAFLWFPIRLLTWIYGGIAGLMLMMLSRRFRLFQRTT
jgi:hypothetical protein